MSHSPSRARGSLPVAAIAHWARPSWGLVADICNLASDGDPPNTLRLACHTCGRFRPDQPPNRVSPGLNRHKKAIILRIYTCDMYSTVYSILVKRVIPLRQFTYRRNSKSDLTNRRGKCAGRSLPRLSFALIPAAAFPPTPAPPQSVDVVQPDNVTFRLSFLLSR